MWGWIKPLLDSLIEFLERQGAKEDTMDDASTPESIKQRWATSTADKLRRMRDENSGS